MTTWEEKIRQFCDTYNIPLEYFPDLIQDPKVIPMIRGKAFEFSVLIILKNILNPEEWSVNKLSINAQLMLQDEDLTITHLPTGKKITLECKLAAKSKYKKLSEKALFEIQVKCMRSRTLGEQKVKDLAPFLNISESVLTVHNDQYLPKDFDFVITSIGNAFYTTDTDTGNYIWNPNSDAIDFLSTLKENLTTNNIESPDIKDFAFEKIYIAESKKLAIKSENHIKCSRRKCPNKENCGFIPNYPSLFFDLKTGQVLEPWVTIEDSEKLLKSFLKYL
jgi:hypothetical protein